MIYLTPFFLLALVAAVPSPPPGTRISISKKPRMLDNDGFVNITSLIQQMMFCTSKYNATMNVPAWFTDSEDPLDVQGAIDVQLTTSNTQGGSNSDPLTEAPNGALWQGSIMVGNPPVSYTVDFDTGSSDLFLPGISCGSSCDGHNRYNPAASSSSRPLGKSFSLAYGDGSTVSGHQYYETVTIAGLSARQQTMGSADRYSTGFQKREFTPDGLMGMGFKAISTYRADPVFQTLVSQGSVSTSVFAFKLASSGAELYLGGTNLALYKPPLAYTAVTKQGYWQVTMDSVSVNGERVLGSTSAIIDTGTTLVVGTTSNVKRVYDNIPGANDAASDVGQGFYTVPCSVIPTVSLAFGGRMFAIAPALFNLGRLPGTQDCVGALVGADVANSVGGWIVGDVFLQNVYTVFDVGGLRVGFAPLS